MYIEYRCPNVSEKYGECRAIMGGPSIESLSAFDFSKAQFNDIRYCPKCHVFYEITLGDANLIPVYRAIEKGQNIDFRQPIVDTLVKS